MNLLLNIIWLICGGFLICVEYIVSSLLLMITIVGIPFGFQTLKLSMLALCPFGREIRSCPGDGGCLSVLMNIIWILVGGIWISLSHLAFGVLLCITVIGIPFGLQHFKLAGLALTPFRKGDCINIVYRYDRVVTLDKMQRPTCVCHHLIPVLIFR